MILDWRTRYCLIYWWTYIPYGL